MNNKTGKFSTACFLFLFLVALGSGERREQVCRLGVDLEKQASYLAQNSYQHFKGWSGTISDQEQAVLFKSEAFAAFCRLFLRLAEEKSNYFRAGYLRTNLYNAFLYLVSSFQDLEDEMRRGGVQPYALAHCRRILDRMDYEFSKWPSPDNLAYLHQKYVKARDDTVYMIERKGPGVYVRHPFKNLESIYRYNYDLNRGKNPWNYLVEVSYQTLEKMEEGSLIDLNFEGYMIIEQSSRSNRPVYLIQDGKKRGLTSPRVVERFGGWGRVYEVPVEVVNKYPEGESIN
ncbi:MAG: hypothetical protein ACLFVG_08670 [Candidatus Aminicenantes bacterium]